MDVAASRAIERVLCKTAPPRRLITLSSKAENLKYPTCVTFTVVSDITRLLVSIGGKEAARLVKHWLDEVAPFPSSVTLSAPTLPHHLRTTTPPNYSILVEHMTPWPPYSPAGIHYPVSGQLRGTLDLSAIEFGIYARDTDVLCQIERFMAMEAMHRRCGCGYGSSEIK